MVIAALAMPVLADTHSEEAVQTEETAAVDNTKSHKAYAAAICVALAAVAGAIGMAMAISKSNESIARQPEAEGSIKSNMMLGLVFIETAIIHALIVAILIIFVL
jgi:F-type H+-transporting ATPase subunit c